MSDNRTAEQVLQKPAYASLRNSVLVVDAMNEFTASLREENERLHQWKESMLKIWEPVIDWGQSKEAGLRPGTDITNEVLRRANEYKQLQEEVERLTGALRSVEIAVGTGMFLDEALVKIQQALSSKESKPS